VPVRSRSGDPAVQFARSPHSTYFPRGSVQRFCGSPGSTGHQVHDPASAYKAFASWPDAETVTIRWTQPAAVQSVESLTLHYRIEGGGAQQVAMAETEPGSGIWEATITPPADQQDRWVDWYITGRFDGAAIDRHDPDTGATAPVLGGRVSDPEHDRDPDHAYTFVFFSHHNPYAGGLPELWPLCKRGTDEYRFDASEQIQPQLINLARWCLDYIGRHTQHHPRRRGSAWEHCCIHMPVHFRWSGANHPGHYLSGGKGGSDNVRPLTNSPGRVVQRRKRIGPHDLARPGHALERHRLAGPVRQLPIRRRRIVDQPALKSSTRICARTCPGRRTGTTAAGAGSSRATSSTRCISKRSSPRSSSSSTRACG
jgi:hypothetical protein